MQERLLSLKDVAKRLSVSERWVAAKVRAGDIPAIKLGKKWRVSEESLENFVKGRILTNG